MHELKNLDKDKNLGLGNLFWQAAITWERLIKKSLNIYSISYAQFVIMITILCLGNKEHRQEISQASIINHSKLDKMTVSKSIKKLVVQGHIKQNESKQDMRTNSVYLTEKGKKIAEKLIELTIKIDSIFFGEIKNSEQKLLIENFNILISNRGSADQMIKIQN